MRVVTGSRAAPAVSRRNPRRSSVIAYASPECPLPLTRGTSPGSAGSSAAILRRYHDFIPAPRIGARLAAAEQVRVGGVARGDRTPRHLFPVTCGFELLPDQIIASLLHRLCQHSALSSREERALARLHPRFAEVTRGTDLVRQGDRPDVSIFLLRGMLARYHTL